MQAPEGSLWLSCVDPGRTLTGSETRPGGADTHGSLYWSEEHGGGMGWQSMSGASFEDSPAQRVTQLLQVGDASRIRSVFIKSCGVLATM